MISLCFSDETLLTSTFKKAGAIFKIDMLDCTATILLLLLHYRLKNLKEANNCQIAGAAKKLSGLPAHVMAYIMRECGPESCKVLRIVKQSQVFFSKEYTRMKKRNCCVVLLSNGKVGEIHFFIWNKKSGNTFAAYKEIEPDLNRPFFFDDAGCHVLRMKSQRYYKHVS